ncbi:hypothetical protein B5M42_024915 [Paenibacillus athensensis]|uniref:DUF2281 domain-containing protein n=1 Tax=Paenibacillus athensensis TaxID=1967502 RepID=A0A4Y8PQ66_9BACL|nr:hypothetical protein [Paenibacillus athensensis]MCD1262026.1 hypothetical protein [Paenibacillus athensensis]
MRISKETIHHLIESMPDNELNEVANFIGYLKMKRDNACKPFETDVYEVTDPDEEDQLLRALNENNPLLSEEDINRMIGQ